MPIVASSRLLIFGSSLPIRKLSAFSVTTWLHRGASISHRTNRRHHSTLTLATIGIKRSERNEPKQASPRSESPKSKKPVRRTTVTKPERAAAAAAAPFAAASFSDLGLPAGLVQRLEDEGFTTPTDVQSAAIPAILEGRDAVIQSYTGSGKTLAYLLPILAEFGNNNNNKNGIGAVIVAPSRELGMQIVREVEKILGPDNKRAVQQLVGGANRARQEEALRKNKPEIVVGTPGRIAEISSSGRLHTHECRYLVLDEVDELLSFNFREDMHRILEHVGKRSGSGSGGPGSKRVERRTILVSATVPFSVVRAARSWADDPLLVRAEGVGPLEPVGPTANPATPPATVQSLPPNLRHYYSVARAQHKVDALRRCVHALEAQSVIAFMNHTRRLKDAVFKLEARGVGAAELHGDLGKLARSATLRRFRAGEVRVLVTNELSARGLDVAECDLVVNLDLPTDPVHYAHRAGRTGRLGRVGTVVTMCEESEVFVVKKIQKQLGVAIPCCEFVEGELVVTEEEKTPLVVQPLT